MHVISHISGLDQSVLKSQLTAMKVMISVWPTCAH